jgi:hypothetical protein
MHSDRVNAQELSCDACSLSFFSNWSLQCNCKPVWVTVCCPNNPILPRFKQLISPFAALLAQIYPSYANPEIMTGSPVKSLATSFWNAIPNENDAFS